MTDSAVPADAADNHKDDPEDQGAAVLELAVTTVAGGATGLAGYAIGGPAGAVVGGAAAPYLAAVFQKVVAPLWADRRRRAEKMMETAAETAGLTLEELADRAAESEQTRFLTDKAVQAAADTIWPEGIRAIGRAYAAGLLAKDKPVLDIRLRVLGIMQDLDEMHVRLLDLLVKYEPEYRHDGLKAIPQRFPSYVNRQGGGDRPDNPKVWSVGRRVWATRAISIAIPEMEQVLPSLLGELRESGLAQENDNAPQGIEQLGKKVLEQLNRQAGQVRSGQRTQPIVLSSVMPNMSQLSEPTWSPTALGEKILGFYAEAGTEDSQDQGEDPGQDPGQ
jgi:hypothetical protein